MLDAEIIHRLTRNSGLEWPGSRAALAEHYLACGRSIPPEREILTVTQVIQKRKKEAWNKAYNARNKRQATDE